MSQHYRSILQLSGGVAPFTNTYSMSFDGVDEYFTVADNDNLSFGNGTTDSPFSISAWVKVTTNGQTILTKRDGTNAEYWFGKSGNLLFIQIYNNGSTSGRRNKYISLTGYEGQWIHLVGAYNGQGGNVAENGLRIYLNGTLQTATTGRVGTYVAMTNTTAPVEIGRTGTNYGEGHIDSVALFNTELSASEVTAIYNSGVPTSLSSYPSLVSWWRMGDGDTWGGSSWTLTDNGSGGNDATSVNMEEADRLPISPNSYTQNSFVFDGVDEYFNIANPTSFIDTGDFSISAWVKYTTTGALHILNIRDNRILYVSNGRIIGAFRKSGVGFVSITSPSLYNDNNWHHVLFVKNSTNLILYVDGTQVISNSNGGATLSGGSSFARISAKASVSNPANYYNGLVDEIAFFESDQSSNVSTIFNNGVPQDISSLSPLSHWRMGENATWNGSTWTLTDQGSGGNDATSVNMEEADKTGDQAYVL